MGVKSKRNKLYYLGIQITALSFSAAIPLISVIITNAEIVKILVSILGLYIAIATGSQSIFKFQEKWTNYRNTIESLRREKLLFITKAAPYNNEMPFSDFVNNVEKILQQENNRWSDVVLSNKKE